MQITVITSERPAVLSKQISRLPDGSLDKTSSAHLTAGHATKATIAHLLDLNNLLDSLDVSQAVAYGVAEQDYARLTYSKALADNPGAITRSDKYFHWPKGDGVMMLDYDPASGQQALGRDELLGRLFYAIPALAAASWLWRPSASGNIYDAATHEELVGLKGQRIYLHVADASDIPRAGEVLFKRLWLQGLGHIELAQNGAMLVRGLVDGSVWQPSRLDFAARALCGPGLYQQAPAGLPMQGDIIDTRKALPDLTDEEEKRYRQLIIDAKNAKQGHSHQRREEFVLEMAEREGTDPDEVRARYDLADERHVLGLDFPVEMAYEEGIVTVADILADPQRFHGKICLDPVEPEYNNRHPVGKIFNDEKGAYIDSKAHGGRVFKLGSVSALAFQQAASDGKAYEDLMAEIREAGCDLARTPDLVKKINEGPFCDDELVFLRAELKGELREAKRLDKNVEKLINGNEAPTSTSSEPQPTGVYGKADAINAAVFLNRQFPDGNACLFDDEVYAYQDGAWRHKGRDTWLTNAVARDMAACDPQGMKMSRASSAAKTAAAMLPERKLGGSPGHLVFFRDCVLNTRNWSLERLDSSHGNTHALAFDYNPNATCPQWEAFVHDVFDGDLESVQLLQEWFGYNVVSSLRHQKIMLLLGVSRSGKGTIGKVLSHILGEENFAGGSLTALTSDHTINALKDKLGYFVGDAEKGIPRNMLHLVVESIKAISGGDLRTFNRKFLSPQTMTIPARITVAANHLPQLFDDSGALANRMLLLCFNKSYIGREDIDLDEKLKAEAVGIINWAMAGLKRLNDNGRFTSPAVSEEEMQHIRAQFSPLQEFIDECCVFDGTSEGATAADIFSAYQAWSIKQGDEQRMTRRSFAEAFKRSAPQFKHVKRRFGGGSPMWGFDGLVIKDDVVVPINSAAEKAFAAGSK